MGWGCGVMKGGMPPWVSPSRSWPAGRSGERGRRVAGWGGFSRPGGVGGLLAAPCPGLPSGRVPEDGVAFSPQSLAFLAGSS